MDPLRDRELLRRWLGEICGRPEIEIQKRLDREEFWPGSSVLGAIRERGIAPHVSSEALEKFYRESDAYLFEDINWNRSALKGWMRTWIARHLGGAEGKPRKVLCFGDGIGVDSLYLSQSGHDATYFEVSRAAVEFARRLFESEKAPIRRVRDFSELAPESFDAVVCLDVLEHVPDPAGLIRKLRALLKPASELIVHAPYGAVSRFLPAHLASNRKHFGALDLYRDAGLHEVCANFLWMPIVLRTQAVPLEERRTRRWNRAGLRASAALMRLSLRIPLLFELGDWGFHVVNAAAVGLRRLG